MTDGSDKSEERVEKSLPETASDLQRPLVHRSEDLLGGFAEAWIEHRGERYRLRLTSTGKLYLTK